MLQELIPGTEDYYFFHALHYQNTGKAKELGEIMTQWAKRNADSTLLQEIRNRQLLLDFDRDPKGALETLRKLLGVTFDHQQERLNAKPDLPVAVDPKQISMEEFQKQALRDPNQLIGVTDAGIEWLLKSKAALTLPQRRVLLGRVRRPDLPGLAELIVEDLKTRESRGFGEFPIHGALLVDQLAGLANARPELMHAAAFVQAWLGKLQPGADVNLERDIKAREAWLDAAWAFVKDLAPSFNSLKAHVLFRRLVHDEKTGQRSPERFLAYLKLPRSVPYLSPKWQENQEVFRHAADLSADFAGCTGFPPIGNDQALVRDYLLAFLADAPNAEVYAPFLSDSFLNPILAEAKLVAGVGDAEKWFSLLSPSAVQTLRERVDLDFDPANPEVLAPDAEVKLRVWVKNVPKLTANVFEINTLNYYRAHSGQIGTDVNLDGLVANVTQAHAYAEPAIRRVARTFAFPEIKGKRGVWIVDLIGNGKSSRVLLRKGQLHFVTRPSSAGTIITVLDEAYEPVAKASALLGGQSYAANEHGDILVPFSSQPGNQPVILTDGAGFAQLEQVNVQGENYALSAGFHVAHESMLSGKSATVAIRPTLTVNGAPVDLSLLEEVKLTVGSHNHDGVAATVVKPDLKLMPDREVTFEFKVPDRLASLQFVLDAKVKSLVSGQKVAVQARHAVNLNQLDTTVHTSDLFLAKVGDHYFLQELGRTGEVRTDRAVAIAVRRSEFSEPRTTNCKTDAAGAVSLGTLDGVQSVEAKNHAGISRTWVLPQDRFDAPANLHLAAGQAFALPWMEGAGVGLDSGLVSLLEVRRGTFVRNALSDKAVAIKDGYLLLRELDAGDYSLRYGSTPKTLTIRVTQGKPAAGFLLGSARYLERTAYSGLQILGISREGDSVNIALGGAGADARVHVLASRYLPDFDAFQEIGPSPGLEPLLGTPGNLRTVYVNGRTLGEEYRYVLDRRQQLKYAGNLLPRPGLLLNPWALRTTETTLDDAMAGEDFRRADDGAVAAMDEAKPKNAPRAPVPPGGDVGISNLDFLAATGATLFNLSPDKDGRVVLKAADLGDRQFIRILALDADSSVVRDVCLPDAGTKVRDLTLRNGLDPQGHFTRQNEITILEKDAPFTINDAATAQFEISGDLGKVFNLFRTLSNNATLAEFAFILDWPGFDAARKRELYSKYACHELSFFLERKDPEFFKTVVLPYLASKRDQTFVDHYLLGTPPLKDYLNPWKYSRLNTVERILLAQREKNEMASTARDIADQFDLLPPDVERLIHLFETTIREGELGGGAEYRWAGKKLLGKAMEEKAPHAREVMAKLEVPAPAAPAPGKPMAGAAPVPEGAPADKKSGGAGAGEGQGRGLKLAERNKRFVKKDNGVEVLMAEAAKEDGYGYAVPNEADREELRKNLRERDSLARQKTAQQLYRKLEPTQEWAENNYYHLPIEQQLAELVTVNRFWKDYAAWDGKGGFVSAHVAEAARNFTEMMFALAVLDLPFPAQAKEPKVEVKAPSLVLTPAHRMILFHREIKPAEIDKDAPRLLVSQNFYREGDRYIQKGGEKLDKFVTEEFLTGIVYGCQVVVTNPTSSTQKLDILVQIPQGAIPVKGAKATDNVPVTLEAYRTHTQDCLFYFPRAGKFPQHPVHVSKSEKVVAFAPAFTFNVVDELTKQDTASWDYLSQHGKPEEVLQYLADHNIRQLNLDKMAWRLHDADFFGKALALLQGRHVYHATAWSYSLLHAADAAAVPARAALGQYLRHADAFVSACGPVLHSPILTIDPVERYTHQHLEYSPLVNARAHQLGSQRTILNDRFRAQYHSLLEIFIREPALTQEDLLAASCYLLLQDRIGEALAFFARVDPAKIREHLQYDYMKAVVSLYQEDAAGARKIAATHAEHPVNKWREKFAEVLAQLDEIEGRKPAAREDDRNQQQNQLAAAEPSLDFSVENREVRLTSRNLKEVTVHYYLMDLEFLFSTAPFVSSDTRRFGMIQPNRTETLALPEGRETHAFALPREYHSSNVLVEITGGGKSAAHAYYANELNVQISENYGRLQVLHAKDNRPLPKTYVKVFAEINGQPKFYKDGYTDLRGKFDYLSLSTGEIDQSTRFSILILSDEFGAAVREVKPPRQ